MGIIYTEKHLLTVGIGGLIANLRKSEIDGSANRWTTYAWIKFPTNGNF